MENRQKTIMKQQEVLGDFNKDNYEAKRLWAAANDGTKVPISLVYRKDKFQKNKNPLWLSAYGSYGSSSDVYFSSVRLSLLDRGFVVATAHVRGGQEMGRYWYDDGKLLKKINTFTDFNSCTEHLINEGYAAKDKVFAWGGSAGGLLIGAIINMQPELYRGVIAAVPFVDVVTTMLDESIPLTTGEFDEWGNPKNKEYYDYMLSYSPYDNVKSQNYPAMLVTTGLHDSQVQYWEPAKWVAKLRDMKTDENRLLLKTNMDFGHGGASGRFERLKEVALEYAFVMDLIGINE
jgi:oligopeptidase B